MNVLVIDDDTVSGFCTRFMAEQQGHTVEFMTNPVEAYQHIQDVQYDVILLDYSMDEMDGITFLKRLKYISYPPKVIMVSSNDRPEYVNEAIDAGATSFLTKPLKPHVLRARLQVVENAMERQQGKMHGSISRTVL